MKFKTHVPAETSAPILNKLKERGLSLAEISRLSRVSRPTLDKIAKGKNCRKETHDKLVTLLVVFRSRELAIRGAQKAEEIVGQLKERNAEYVNQHGSIWGRLKTWFIARFY